jgi:fatty acid synthase subunit alpha, fungi type
LISPSSTTESADGLEPVPHQEEAELFARFMNFVVKDLAESASRLAVLKSTFYAFVGKFLTNVDVHTFVADFETEARQLILSSFYSTLMALQHAGVEGLQRGPPSSLIADAATRKASVYALFGGQGANEIYFDELFALFKTYKAYVEPYIRSVSKNILAALAEDATTKQFLFYGHGLDVLSWLTGEKQLPPVDYLASIPISFPLIGLTQLVQYLVSCHVSGLTPGELRDRLAGATGHSQGIISAVALSTSDSFDSFTRNSIKALRWLFYCGLRGQEAFPTLALDPSIVKDSTEGGEGIPSPMLSVTGLQLDTLTTQLEKTNRYLEGNSQLHISLHNGPRAFVITGPPKCLYGLVVNLRKIKAPSGLDQSKTPFSQRKSVFSVRFLAVGVPYHNSLYLADAAQRVCEEDLAKEELFSPADLAISVYNTEDGALIYIPLFSIPH